MGKHGKQSKSDNSLKILLALLIVAIIVCLAFGGKQYLEDKSPVNVAEDNQKQNNVIVEDETAEHTGQRYDCLYWFTVRHIF